MTTTSPDPSTLPDRATDRAFARSSYSSLRSFRRDGRAVEHPIWFACADDGGTVWFRTKTDTAKVRRLRADPRVELRPCSWRGAVASDAPVLIGRARLLEPGTPDAQAADRALAARYGWRWYTLPLFRTPGTRTVKVDLPLHEKLRLIRAKAPLPDSTLVAIDLCSDGRG